MSAASDYLENVLLDHTLRNTAFTSPTAVYVGLSTGSFGDDNSGTELSGNGYARQVITCSAASSGSITNSSQISFPTATGSWGTVSHAGVFDASSSGNLLFHGALSSSKAIESGDVLKIDASSLTFTLA